MNTSVTAALGVLFLILSVVTTYLMFQFWGYPYDKEKKKSECPQWKMNIHRGCGYAYAAVYVILMTQMIPRLWQYQVEFEPRTVAHIMLGITIGVILMVKISILRWFRHFEEWMPYLGTALLLCTFLLSGLSLPFAAKERAEVGQAFTAANIKRVEALLPGAGLPEGTDLAKLSTKSSLSKGREVLLGKCTYCHDLRTAIARPRTPADWARTVRRMADKPTLGPQIDLDESAQATAYLIAITTKLQDSAKAKREAENKRLAAMKAMKKAVDGEQVAVDGEQVASAADAGPPPAAPAYDAVAAKQAYEDVCSQCHELDEVTAAPPTTAEEVDELMVRMVENGLEEEKQTLEIIKQYLNATFVEK